MWEKLRNDPRWLTSGAARTLLCVLLATVALLGATAQAAAPKMCIPNAAGVPGSSGPPDWWDPGQTQPGGGANIFAYQPFDPRWRGAMVLDYGSGSVSEVEYRALYNSESEGEHYILLSWQVKSVMQFSIDNTALYSGFYNPVANKGAVLKVTLKNTSSGVDSNFPGRLLPAVRSSSESGTTYFDVALTTGTGTDPAAWTTPANPAWLSGTLRAWINAQTNPYTWTVQLRVPLDADIANGLDLQAASFRMWYYAQIEGLLGSTSTAIVPFTWPRPDPSQPVLTYASFQQGIVQKYPAASTWGDFALVADPAADATCSGVYLATDHIGTRSTPFNSEIKLNADNTFFAEPENKTNTAINNGVLTATFRIANWGSQVGATSAASWTAPNALTNVAGGAVAANDFGNIEGHWNPSLSDADICPFIGQSGAGGVPGRPACPNQNPTRMLHQCMMVELQGPGLNFVRDSAIRNMNFVKASRFEREAEISVVGLPGLAAGKRDVFLYVERRNMPRFTPGGSGGEQPTPDRPQPPAEPAPDVPGIAAGANGVSRQPSDEELAASVPTWIVHGYHDSGEKIHLSNKDYKVLTPQTAFGYFVSHEGAFEGWADVIEGADRLREDLYKVAPPNDGAVRVKTIVQAVEAGEQPVGQPWPPSSFKWWWIALLVLVLLALIILLRRKSS